MKFRNPPAQAATRHLSDSVIPEEHTLGTVKLRFSPRRSEESPGCAFRGLAIFERTWKFSWTIHPVNCILVGPQVFEPRTKGLRVGPR